MVVRAELGGYPVALRFITRNLKYWLRTNQLNDSCLVKKSLTESQNLSVSSHTDYLRHFFNFEEDINACSEGLTVSHINRLALLWKNKLESYYSTEWLKALNTEIILQY